jgi:hypothetical protein
MALNLLPGADDARRVIARALSTAATVCSLLLVCSFGIFAYDQVAHGAAHQASEIVSSPGAPAPSAGRPAPQPKRIIDGAAAALRSPFDSVVVSGSAWVQIGVPTVLALAVYGFGLGFAARYARASSLANRGPRMRPPHITHL